MNNGDRAHSIRSHYDRRLRPGRPGFEAADWADAAGQQARFEVLLQRVDLSGRTLLDVGCGLGDLWALLKQRGIDVRYTGVDLSDRIISAARQRHTDACFEARDVFTDDADTFDVVFASGIFNLKLGNNVEFIREAAGRLVELAREAAVFNFLDDRAEQREDYCHYYDDEAVQAILADLPGHCEVVRDYLPHDTTLLCRKTQ